MFKYHFKFRGFVSLLTTASFLISLVSGIVLYFTPQGKIANWTNWTFWGLDKHTWGALHINSSLIFFIIILVHIYYNWKLLWSYIKKRAQTTINLKMELALVLLFSIYLVVASIQNVQPFKQIMDWNEGMKEYWAHRMDAQPPVPHAEDFTVAQFCQAVNIPLDDFQKIMLSKGWSFSPEQTIQDIAKSNNIAPAAIYESVRSKNNLSERNGNGQGNGGWGRMTVEQVCQQNDVPLTVALANLSQNGIEASARDQVRLLSARLKKRPSVIVEIITGQKNHGNETNHDNHLE